MTFLLPFANAESRARLLFVMAGLDPAIHRGGA
jgi:hypothetical protein